MKANLREPHRWKRVIFRVFIAILALAGFFYWISEFPQTARLPDGTDLVLRSVKLGATNTYKHGNALEKLLDFGGVKHSVEILGMDLQPPQIVVQFAQGSSALTFQFECIPQLLSQAFPRSLRFIHRGEDGFPYVTQFPKGWTGRDGMFLYLTADTFARSSRIIQIELQERETQSADWKSIAQFHVKNPRPARPIIFHPAPLTGQTNGALLVHCESPRVRIDRTSSKWDLWPARLEIPLRVFNHDLPATNQIVTELQLEDELGNRLVIPMAKRITNGSTLLTTFRTLSPHHPWRIGLRFSPDANLQLSNKFVISLPAMTASALRTNIQGVTLEAVLQRDLLQLGIITPSSSPDCHLHYLKCETDDGEVLNELEAHSSRHSAGITFAGFPGTEYLNVTFGIVPSKLFTFIIQPEVVNDDPQQESP